MTTVQVRAVSLGALGFITMPRSTDSRGFFLAGLDATFPLSERLAVTVQPSLRIVPPPLSPSVTDYSIAGGLRVGIF